jgi:ketosteroid isomerase-like protein
MGEHPNVARVHEYLATYRDHAPEDLAPFFADDIVWRVGGGHHLSGTYRGKDEVLAYIARSRELTGGTLSLEPDSILASDRHLAMFTHVTGERNGRQLDANLAQVVVIDDEGAWKEYWALSDDQESIDQFWS